MEMPSTLQQLNIRINNFAPRRIHHITYILNRIFQTKFSVEQIKVRLENWELILPMYNDCIGGKSSEEIEKQIKSYFTTQHENCSSSLLNCFITLLNQCINRERLKKGTLFLKTCSKCSCKYFYNYYIRPDGQKMLTIHPDDEVFIVFSNYGYEKRLLMQIDSDILFKHCGFSNYANAFNHLNYKFEKKDEELMDRFHLQKTWFIWRLGNFCIRENFRILVPDQQDFQTMLLELLPFVKRWFTENWGKRDYHAFCEGNYSSTIVLDGHQKATRRVCAIKNISVPSYDGAIRDVKVGCSATPVFKSKNCQEHLLSNDNRNGEPVLSNVRLPRTRRNVRSQRELGSFQFNLRCKTLKSLQYKRILRRTSGIIAAAYNCGFICSLSELFGCESISQVYNFLLYMNPWCRLNTNPYNDPIANDTNTEICEQIFAWLAQYKNIVRGFNESTFLIYICLICDLLNTNKFENLRKEYILTRAPTTNST
ncbi:unnamed protein product [Rotaria magnacalcarata]